MSKIDTKQPLCFEQHNGYGGVDFDGNPWPFGYISIDGPIKEPVFELQTFIKRDRKQLDAIVRLMTAAPDMLATLKAVLAHVEDETVERTNGQCTLCFSYRQMIRATIAKAEGR